MFELLPIFAICMFGANYSQNNNGGKQLRGKYGKFDKDIGFIICAVVVILMAGFRIEYNDTAAYWEFFFKSKETVKDFFTGKTDYGLTGNPGWYFYCAVLRLFSPSFADRWIMFLPVAIFCEYSYIKFMKRYSVSFLFSVFLFFTLGFFCFSMAATKQAIAMGILTYAFEAVEKKKWKKFVILVFVAMLFHTYAIVFIILPFLRSKPWTLVTFVLIIGFVIVAMNFESILGTVIDSAEEMGKTISHAEVTDSNKSNLLRILVFAVPPALSFIFRNDVYRNSTASDNMFANLSIISFFCIFLGLFASANSAERLSEYFLFGQIIGLPLIIEKGVSPHSKKTVLVLSYICYFIYFFYKFGIANNFDAQYNSIIYRYIQRWKSM